MFLAVALFIYLFSYLCAVWLSKRQYIKYNTPTMRLAAAFYTPILKLDEASPMFSRTIDFLTDFPKRE